MNILLQWNIFGKGNYLVLKDNKETDKKLAFSTEIELNIWSLNLVYLIQRARNVYHHKTKHWIIVIISPSWILIDFSFQDAVKFCDAKSCWNANMSTHSRRVWAISLYYWPCSNTCETGPPFVPIPYKSFLLQSFSLHKSWRKVSCMAIQINCLAIKGYQDTQVGPICSFMQTFLEWTNETIRMYFWFSNIFALIHFNLNIFSLW